MNILTKENEKINEMIDKLNDLKYTLNNGYKSLDETSKSNILSRIICINDKMEDLTIDINTVQHELDTKNLTPSPEIEQRIFNYEKEQAIMKPFIPALFLYSCYMNKILI